MIFIVPHVVRRERHRIAGVLLVRADTFAEAERRVSARYAGAVRVGDAVELDVDRGDAQFIEAGRWSE